MTAILFPIANCRLPILLLLTGFNSLVWQMIIEVQIAIGNEAVGKSKI